MMNHKREGFALLDVLVGGLVLSIALTAIFGLTRRSLSSQLNGEKRQQASMLIDSLLNQVLAIGPVNYPSTFSTRGVADPPFDEFEYEIRLEDAGIGHPYNVTATVSWYVGSRPFQETVETKIAPMMGEVEANERVPEQPVNRNQ